MKLALKIVAAATVVFLLVLAVGAIYVDHRFGLIRSAPYVSHASLTNSNTAIRLVIDPAQAADEIHEYLSRYQTVPKWALSWVVPYEVALLIGADLEEEKVDVSFHIMERRLGPVVLDYAKVLGMHNGFSYVTWNPPDMTRTQAGVLTVQGVTPMESRVGERAWLLWNQSRTLPSLKLEGGHFAELVMDNRQAGSYAAMASFLPYYNIETEELHRDEVVDMISKLKEARMAADFQGRNQVRMAMSLVFREEAIEDLSLSMKLLVDLIVDAIKDSLKQRHSIEFVGETKWNGNVLEGEFILKDFDTVLGLLLGQRQEE